MKKFINFSLVSAFFFVLFFSQENLEKAFAHSIPPAILQFLIDNPEASDEEINTFFDKNNFNKEQLQALEKGNLEDFSTTKDFQNKEFELKNSTINFPRKIYNNKELNISKTWYHNTWNFISLGFKHILDGLDHILFVVSLLLIIKTWRKIFAIITTFTLAHSITLGLAGTGLFSLSSEIIEPLIAFSILYMSIMNGIIIPRYPQFDRQKFLIPIVFFFGLFHGLGFAGALQDLEISQENFFTTLFSFNLGIEFGQFLIVIIVLPFFLFLREKFKNKIIIFQFIGGLISLLALWWLVERILT
jgi:hydrogenase/urease accessory protein HupE